jgi:hypothetical protein
VCSLADSHSLSRGQPSELLNQSWNKDKLKYRAQNVCDALARLNRLSFWVPSMILWQERVKDRAKVYAKFVSIAEVRAAPPALCARCPLTRVRSTCGR